MKKLAEKMILFVWLPLTFLLVGFIHSWHSISFNPKDTTSINQFVHSKKWGMIHIISSNCGCSEYLANYLIERGPLESKYSEEVLFIGPKTEYLTRLETKGFNVKRYLENEFKDTGAMIDGVPLLVVHNDNQEIRYAGGYSPTSINSNTKYKDIDIFNGLYSGKNTDKLPAIGCSVSKKLIKFIDPLGMKYTGVSND